MTIIPSKVDILLINPPSGVFYGLGPNFAPMGLFSLAAVLRPKGFAVAVLNANYFPQYQSQPAPGASSGSRRPDDYYYAEDHDNPIWEAVLNFIQRCSPHLVGFSAHDLAVGGIKKLAAIIKERWPQRLVAVGGPTATCAPEIFDDSPAVDYLLSGEGEETLTELAETLRRQNWEPLKRPLNGEGRPIAGLWSGQPRTFGGPRPHLTDLDALPRPDLSYFWLDYHAQSVVMDQQLNGLASSRGCLKSCRFCGAKSMWPGPLRYRSIEKVVVEAAALRAEHGYAFQHFSIFDDDFLARPERVRDFCRRLRALNDDYAFRCYGRVNNLQDEEILEELFQAGCREIWVGVESGSPKVLKSMGKGITVAQTLKMDELFHNYDFPWLCFIILGTPDEEESDILQTLEMLEQGHFPSIQPFTFQPYTGTVFYQRLKEAGCVSAEDIIRGHQNLPQCFSQHVPRERFYQLFERLRQLAAKRWRKLELYPPASELEQAKTFERWALDYLKSQAGRRLVALGPERQLRWLAALNHYGRGRAELSLVDLDAESDRSCRFGQLKTLASYEAGAEEIIVVSPASELKVWRERAAQALPHLPLSLLAQAPLPRLWRPVFELCRELSVPKPREPA